MKVAKQKRRGLLPILAYTIAGAVTSALVGIAYGTLGQAVIPAAALPWAVVLVILVTAAVVVSEAGLWNWRIPQNSRQTNVTWGRLFRPTIAAVLWGADLGLVVTTRATFAGTWSLLALAVVSRSPITGGALLLAYWLARAAQVWIAALVVRGPLETPIFLRAVYRDHKLLQWIHVAGLIWATSVLGFLLRAGDHL